MANPLKVKVEVLQITKVANDCFIVAFGVPHRATRFKAGQFLHLALDAFDPSEGYWPDSRVFSIASKPGDDIIEIVYSVKGSYTKRMEEELSVGRQVWLKLPYGDFIVERHVSPSQHAVFIAGGTGISPFIPFFHQVLEQGLANQITVYYGIRDQEHFLFKSVLEEIAPYASVCVVEGLFDVEAISKDIASNADAVCFISGPPAMIQAFQRELKQQGVNPDTIIIDAWG